MLKVLKFGGTSVGTLDRIANVAQIIKKIRDEGVERIKMSVVLEILKKSDVRYEKLGYSRMRVSLLYGKKFKFEKGEDGMVEVVKVGV